MLKLRVGAHSSRSLIHIQGCAATSLLGFFGTIHAIPLWRLGEGKTRRRCASRGGKHCLQLLLVLVLLVEHVASRHVLVGPVADADAVALVLGRKAKRCHATGEEGIRRPAANPVGGGLHESLPLVVDRVVAAREKGRVYRPRVDVVVLLGQVYQLAALGDRVLLLLLLLNPAVVKRHVTVVLLLLLLLHVEGLGHGVKDIQTLLLLLLLLLLAHVKALAVWVPKHLPDAPRLLLLLLLLVRMSSVEAVIRQAPHILEAEGQHIGSMLLKVRLLLRVDPSL